MFRLFHADVLSTSLTIYTKDPSGKNLENLKFLMKKHRYDLANSTFNLNIKRHTHFYIFLEDLFETYPHDKHKAYLIFKNVLTVFSKILPDKTFSTQVNSICSQQTPLLKILQYNSDEITKTFLTHLVTKSAGYSTFLPSMHYLTPLFIVLQQNNPQVLNEIIQYFEKTKVSKNEIRIFLNPDDTHTTALHFIAATDNINLLRLYVGYLIKYFGNDEAELILKDQAEYCDIYGNYPSDTNPESSIITYLEKFKVKPKVAISELRDVFYDNCETIYPGFGFHRSIFFFSSPENLKEEKISKTLTATSSDYILSNDGWDMGNPFEFKKK